MIELFGKGGDAFRAMAQSGLNQPGPMERPKPGIIAARNRASGEKKHGGAKSGTPREPHIGFTLPTSSADRDENASDPLKAGSVEKGASVVAGSVEGRKDSREGRLQIENGAVGEQRETRQDFGRILERVLERRGLDSSALEFIREWVEFPELMLTPTKSAFKPNFLDGFLKALAPEEDIICRGIAGSSEIHEQPYGQAETEEGAKNRLGNAMALVSIRRTGDEELDSFLKEKTHGYVGVMENGMVAGRTDSDGVHLDTLKSEYDPRDEHFDVAYAIVRFPGFAVITKVSPPDEAVRFDPRDADASFDNGFTVTAGECMQKRLAQEDPPVVVDKQNWHGYAIAKEIEEARRLAQKGLPTTGLHTQEFEGFDRNEQLAGVLFDAFYQLAQNAKAEFDYIKYLVDEREKKQAERERAEQEKRVLNEMTMPQAQEILEATLAIPIASLTDSITHDTTLEEVFGYTEAQLRHATGMLAQSRLDADEATKEPSYTNMYMRNLLKSTPQGDLWLIANDHFVQVRYGQDMGELYKGLLVANTIPLDNTHMYANIKYNGFEEYRNLEGASEYQTLLARNSALGRFIGIQWMNNILLNWPNIIKPDDMFGSTS